MEPCPVHPPHSTAHGTRLAAQVSERKVVNSEEGCRPTPHAVAAAAQAAKEGLHVWAATPGGSSAVPVLAQALLQQVTGVVGVWQGPCVLQCDGGGRP